MVKKLTNGELADADEVMDNFKASYTQQAYNLIDNGGRAGNVFKGQNAMIAEVYTDANGAQDSVNTGNTTLLYDSDNDKYIPALIDEASGDTTHDPDSFTNPSNAFDSDDDTNANKFNNTSSFNVALGKTFTNKQVDIVRVIYEMQVTNTGGSAGNSTIKLQTYNGSVWSDFQTLEDVTYNVNINKTERVIVLDSSVQGVRLAFEFNRIPAGGNQADPKLYSLEYGDTTQGVLEHSIPSGTFKSDISSGFFACQVADLEEGARITCEVENATETSGSIEGTYDGTSIKWPVKEFTAFTSEPTKYTITLIPKTTSPTAGYPSIKGTAILSE